MTRKRTQFLTVFVVAGVLLLGLMLVGTTQAQRRRPKRKRKPAIVVGQVAPDFELPELKSTTASIKDGKVDLDKAEKVKLSAFRGKRPVCLLFTSCT